MKDNIIKDMIVMLRWNIQWKRFNEVRELIKKVEDPKLQQELWKLYNEQCLQKSLHQIKYDVTGGKPVGPILEKMKEDLSKNHGSNMHK